MGIEINFLLKFESNLRFVFLNRFSYSTCCFVGILIFLFIIIYFPKLIFEDKHIDIIIAKNPLK